MAMTRCMHLLHPLLQLTRTLLTLLCDGVRFLGLCLRPSPNLAAENPFLRKQLAMYQERHVKPRRATSATCLVLVWLSRWFDWQQALAVAQPRPFSIGIDKHFVCSGGGDLVLGVLRSLRNSKRSSAK